MTISDIATDWKPLRSLHRRDVPPDQWPARLEQAQAAVDRALRLAPASARAHQLRGVVLRMQGDPERAIAAFQRALALDPAGAWTYAEFARTKIDVGRAAEAIADIETALRLSPSEVAVHVWYCWAGMAALHAGRPEDAVRWLRKALDARPVYPHPVPLLAAAYAESGREADARAVIAAIFDKVPDFTMHTVRRDYPSYNAAVAVQRERIAQALLRAGVPDVPLQTGTLR